MHGPQFSAMNAARTTIGFFALLGVAQKSCYQHRVDDADDTERNYKNGHQRDKVDFSDKSQVLRIDGEAEIKVGALRLIGTSSTSWIDIRIHA